MRSFSTASNTPSLQRTPTAVPEFSTALVAYSTCATKNTGRQYQSPKPTKNKTDGKGQDQTVACTMIVGDTQRAVLIVDSCAYRWSSHFPTCVAYRTPRAPPDDPNKNR